MRQRRFGQIDDLAFEPSTDPLRPEKNLLLGVLERAIRDALGMKGILPPSEEMPALREARLWLGLEDTFRTEESPEEWSFQWICQYLCLDPGYIHSHMERAVAGCLADKSKAYQIILALRKRTFMHMDQQAYLGGKKTAG